MDNLDAALQRLASIAVHAHATNDVRLLLLLDQAHPATCTCVPCQVMAYTLAHPSNHSTTVGQ